jgi:two-component system, OmpR family, alkaline phosphatase synthesis response regulator PhoP
MINSEATILVVDDEENIRQLIRLTLEEAGYKVLTASTGQEAFDKVSSSNISLVLLDIVMPGMDGFRALELIREKSDIPVIMVSGLGNMNPLRTSFIMGADDYIKKPFHSRELLARIEAKLRRMKN